MATNHSRYLLTRQEIERRLERGLVGQVVTYSTLRLTQVSGKIHRLTVTYNDREKELLVIFIINNLRYEADLRYFADNLIIHTDYGNTHGGNRSSVRRILKGN